MKPSIQEASILASMGGALLGLAGYGVYLASLYKADQLDVPHVGLSTLGLMLACVVLRHLLQWLLHRCFGIRQAWIPFTPMDERDKLIELKGMQASYATSAVGFVASLLLLWSGADATLGFGLIATSLVAGEVISGLVRLYQYRSEY
jgi:hypothetical protein